MLTISDAVEVTIYEPVRASILTRRGRMTYLDWCIAEVERMRAAGADAGLDVRGRPPNDICCVVRRDNPLQLPEEHE